MAVWIDHREAVIAAISGEFLTDEAELEDDRVLAGRRASWDWAARADRVSRWRSRRRRVFTRG